MFAHPGHVYPSLQQSGSLVGLQRRVAQAGGDDTVGDWVELSHSGSDGGSKVLLSLLIPLRPDPPQAVVGHHLLKQILERDGNTEMWNTEKKKKKRFHFESILDLDNFIEMSGRRAERKGKHAHRVHERELLGHHDWVKRQETKSRKFVLKAALFLRCKRAADVFPWRDKNTSFSQHRLELSLTYTDPTLLILSLTLALLFLHMV